MRKLGKVLSLVLAVSCAASIFTGCGSKKGNGDKKVISWWYCGNGIQEDTKKVQDKINEMIKSKDGLENVEIELKPSVSEQYANDVSLAMASGKQMDILNTFRLNFSELVRDGILVDIDEYVNDMPELKKVLPEWLWEMGQIDGKTYMVPNYQRATNMNFYITPKKYADAYGDFDNLRKTLGNSESGLQGIADEIEKYLLNVRANFGATKYTASIANMYASNLAIGDFHDILADNFVVYKGTDKVVHKNLTDKMKEAYDISAKWFDKGYIPEDSLTQASSDTYSANKMLNDVSVIASTNNQIGDEQTVSEAFSKRLGFDCYALPIKNKYYVSNSWAAGGHGITVGCKYPKEAMRFLELMFTEEGKDVYNTVVYGIEGVHYEKTGDDTIKTFEYDATQGGVSTKYAAMKWCMGNAFNAYDNQGCVKNEKQLSKALNESKDNVVSDLMGFYPDVTKIKNELAQIKAVDEEYRSTLYSGIKKSEWKTVYSEYEKKLKAAGLEKVLSELQGQLDEFNKK